MPLVILLLDNGGPHATLTPLLKEQLALFSQQHDSPTQIRSVTLYDAVPSMTTGDVVAAIVIGGSSIIDLDDIRTKGNATSWNIQMVEAFPTAHVFGVCYGHQVLAAMHGGTVAERAAGFRTGSIPIHRCAPSSTAATLRMRMHVSHRHFVQTAPPQYTILEVDDAGDVMAMTATEPTGRILTGVQYHIEAPGSQPFGTLILSHFLRRATTNAAAARIK
jgi:GMP synthase-like glutamine amidotransferase